jgi:hypothetical protein
MISFHGKPVMLFAELLFSMRLLPLPCMGSLYYRVYPVTVSCILLPGMGPMSNSIRPNVVPPGITTFLQLPRYVHEPPEHVLVLRSLLLTCPLASLYRC